LYKEVDMTFRTKLENANGKIVLLPKCDIILSSGLLGEPEPSAYDASTSTQRFPLGTKLIDGERIWRYALAGAAALVAGQPQQQAAALHAEAPDDIVVGAASAAGDYTVTLTSTANIACNANVYRDGYLIVNDEAGEGHSYKIKSHEALSGTSDAVFTLYDPIIVALTTSSQVGITRNPYASTIVAPGTTPTGIVLGVAPRSVTAAYYYWLQTGGPCAVVAHAAIAVGAFVTAGLTAAKVDPSGHDATYGILQTQQIIGQALTLAVTDGESFLVNLTLDR